MDDKEQSYFDPTLNIKIEPELTIVDVASEDSFMVENDHDPHQNEIERKTRRYKRRSNQNCAASKIFGCDSCEKKFTALSSLNRHVLCHHSEFVDQFCKICKKNVKNLSYHLATFHSNISHSCELCNFSTKYIANLDTHYNRIHSKTKKFECNHCNRKFNDQSNKNRHIRMTHPTEARVRFECQICPNSVTFSRSDNLNLHLKRIHGIRKSSPITDKFQCDLCITYVTFVTKVSLIHHMRQEHIKSNMMREIFKCDLCPKKFFSKDSLGQHLNSIHLKKFVCRFCDKILGSEKTLTKHEIRGKCHN